MKEVLKIYRWFMEVLFPDRCVSCQKEGMLFCSTCVQTLRPLVVQECPGCFSQSPYGTFCAKCQTVQSNLDFLLVGASYKHNPILSLLVKTMKYKNIKRVMQYIPQLLWSPLQQLVGEKSYAHIVFLPVPLHARRKKERGFNQAELIALWLGEHVSLPVESGLLERTRYTIPQATLGRQERLANLRGAFRLREVPREDTCYILIDDVSSTRSTLEECADVLRKGGAHSVGAFVLARH